MRCILTTFLLIGCLPFAMAAELPGDTYIVVIAEHVEPGASFDPERITVSNELGNKVADNRLELKVSESESQLTKLEVVVDDAQKPGLAQIIAHKGETIIAIGRVQRPVEGPYSTIWKGEITLIEGNTRQPTRRIVITPVKTRG